MFIELFGNNEDLYRVCVWWVKLIVLFFLFMIGCGLGLGVILVSVL